MQSTLLRRFGLASAWSQEAVIALVTLALGFGLMPLLIYYGGSEFLGRYDDASVARLYDSVYRDLKLAEVAAVIVVFAPYGLYLVFKALRFCWRASAKLA